MKLKAWHISLALVLLVGILAGCGAAAAPSTDGAPAGDDGTEMGAVTAGSTGGEASAGAVVTDSYENALPVSSQFALGTLQLSGTENAVTSEQAPELLPLWQIIESGALKSEAETSSVLEQIEGAMTAEQLAAIAAMQLTFEDMGTWAQDQGVNLGGPGDGPRGLARPEGMTEEDMDAMRAARKTGEGESGPPDGMTEEDRGAVRATAEANGMTRPDSAGSMGAGQLTALAGPLVELLAELASR